jgi:hypothetical protein
LPYSKIKNKRDVMYPFCLIPAQKEEERRKKRTKKWAKDLEVKAKLFYPTIKRY